MASYYFSYGVTPHYIRNVVSCGCGVGNVVWLWCQCGVPGLLTKAGSCGPP